MFDELRAKEKVKKTINVFDSLTFLSYSFFFFCLEVLFSIPLACGVFTASMTSGEAMVLTLLSVYA